MRIIFIGMKGGGKTTIGKLLAKELGIAFMDSDTFIEKMHERERGEVLPADDILRKYGQEYFHALESNALKQIAQEFGTVDLIFSCGGRTPLQRENQEILSRLGRIVFLNVEKAVLLRRILAQGIPVFFPYQDNPEKSLAELLTAREPVYKKLADITIDVSEQPPEEIMHTILMELGIHGKNE